MQQQRRKSRDAARGKQEHGGDEWPKTHNITELTLAAGDRYGSKGGCC